MPWYHRIKFSEAFTTPGVNDSPRELALLDSIGLPKSCAKLRVLDIGCADGFFSFEMERRGGDVTALDRQPARGSGFAIARRQLGSRVKYVEDTVYNLNPKHYGMFDLILFLGVIYHLRHPVLALDRIRSIARDSSLLFVESEIIPPPGPAGSLVQFETGRGHHRADPSIVWVPTLSALSAMLTRSQFQGEEQYASGSRGALRARAISDSLLEESQVLDARASL